jgi:uncharacterized protein involved in exopolysaccharide biosynthesis
MNDLETPIESSNIDEVNLIEVYNSLLESKKFIILFSALITIIGIIYSLWVPKIWTSSALLTVAESSNSSFSNSSAMGGLASIASLGMSDGNSRKGSKAIAIAQSREFFDHLLTFENVLANLMAVKSFNAEESSNIYDESTYDAVKKRWIASQPANWIAYKEYNEVLTIAFDAKSNFVTMSVSHRSPKFAQEFLELIIRELNLLSRNRALQQSQASLNYLYEELGSSQLNDVRLAISQLIETQLKTQMLARVKVDYSLESVDKPYFPNERSSPQRKKITFLALFLGIFLSTFFVLIRFFLKKNLN